MIRVHVNPLVPEKRGFFRKNSFFDILSPNFSKFQMQNISLFSPGSSIANPPPPGHFTGYVFFERLLGTDLNASCQPSVNGSLFVPRVEKNMLYN